MKAKMPEVFNYLMRQQNANMSNTTIIPIFGYTPNVQKQQITIDGESTTVELAMATTKDIIRIKATPSTWNLNKYLVIVKTDKKSSVMKDIQQIFQQIEGSLKNQPENFPFSEFIYLDIQTVKKELKKVQFTLREVEKHVGDL
jgi:hypothetical protein